MRSDEETRHLIAEAAMREFLTHGYAGACMDDVAKRAKVSKKTLYRLIPAKADLFRVSVTDRIAGFLQEAEAKIDTLDVAGALEHYLTELGNLTLSGDTIAILRLAIAEADRFPELATNFYADAVLTGESVLTRFLKRQCALGVLDIDDPVDCGQHAARHDGDGASARDDAGRTAASDADRNRQEGARMRPHLSSRLHGSDQALKGALIAAAKRARCVASSRAATASRRERPRRA